MDLISLLMYILKLNDINTSNVNKNHSHAKICWQNNLFHCCMSDEVADSKFERFNVANKEVA